MATGKNPERANRCQAALWVRQVRLLKGLGYANQIACHQQGLQLSTDENPFSLKNDVFVSSCLPLN